MSLTLPKINKEEYLFFIAYVIFDVFSILSFTFYYQYYVSCMKYILYFCALLLIASNFINLKVNSKSIWGAIVCFLLFVIAYRFSLTVAVMILFIFTARNIRFEKIAKYTLVVTGFTLFFVIFSAETGIIRNYLDTRRGRHRYYLGFRYALHAPTLYFNLICVWVYIKKKREIILSLLFLVLDAVFFLLTNSRITAFLTAVVLLLGLFRKKKKKNTTRSERQKDFPLFLAAIPSYIFYGVLSIILTVYYSASVPWMKKLNLLLSYRLSLGMKALVQYGVGFWGKKIELIGNGLDIYGNIQTETYNYVDNLYIQVLIRYGIIFTVIYLLVMTVFMYRCYKEKDYLLLIILAFIGFHCLVDDMQLYLQYNTFWLLLGQMMMKSRKRSGKYHLAPKGQGWVYRENRK